MSGGLPCAAIGARRARTSALSGSTVLKAPTRIGLRRWSARAAPTWPAGGACRRRRASRCRCLVPSPCCAASARLLQCPPYYRSTHARPPKLHRLIAQSAPDRGARTPDACANIVEFKQTAQTQRADIEASISLKASDTRPPLRMPTVPFRLRRRRLPPLPPQPQHPPRLLPHLRLPPPLPVAPPTLVLPEPLPPHPHPSPASLLLLLLLPLLLLLLLLPLHNADRDQEYSMHPSQRASAGSTGSRHTARST